MRKVVVYERVPRRRRENPDGFFADWDDAMEANLGAVIAAQDSVILGRRSFEEWAEFWPGRTSSRSRRSSTGSRSTCHLHAAHRKSADTIVVEGELVQFVGI